MPEDDLDDLDALRAAPGGVSSSFFVLADAPHLTWTCPLLPMQLGAALRSRLRRSLVEEVPLAGGHCEDDSELWEGGGDGDESMDEEDEEESDDDDDDDSCSDLTGVCIPLLSSPPPTPIPTHTSLTLVCIGGWFRA